MRVNYGTENEASRIPLITRSLFMLVNQRFSESLQHLPLVVFKVSIDLVYRPVFHHPQVALSLRNQAGIVAHDDYGWKRQATTVSFLKTNKKK